MWTTEWRAISARIAALIDAGTFFSRTNDNDNYGAAGVLIENADATVIKTESFFKLHGTQLADGPQQCLQSFLNDYRDRFKAGDKNDSSTAARGFSGVTAVLTSLACFRAEFEYLIADTEATARSLVIRAFTHLQRSIIADEIIRKKWQGAFTGGEPKCEALGACHLLAHGIWAFKTSAKGERTDLVLGEPLVISDDTRRASEGLVLTEWKLVRKKSELSAQTEQAYQQAKRYCEGMLAGYEITSRRYLIMISEDFLEMRSARQEAEATYEYRNIAVNPATPSRGTRSISDSRNEETRANTLQV